MFSHTNLLNLCQNHLSGCGVQNFNIIALPNMADYPFLADGKTGAKSGYVGLWLHTIVRKMCRVIMLFFYLVLKLLFLWT